MNYLGIDYSVKNMPLLDNAFIPFGVWAEAYLKEAVYPFKIAIERENGFVSVFETKLRSDAFAAANYRYAERFVKMLLYVPHQFIMSRIDRSFRKQEVVCRKA